MFRNLLLLIFIFTFFHAFGQENLIHDPSFEQVLPAVSWDKLRIEQNLSHWKETASGEILYIHRKHRIGKPEQNIFGKQPPRTGNALVGMKFAGRFYSQTSGDVRRYYLQTELKRALTKGKKYRLSYFISHGELSSLALARSQFQALLCKEEFPRLNVNASLEHRIYDAKISKTGEALDIGRGYASLWLRGDADTIIAEKENWTEISFEFTANGGEKFLYIGNFEQQEKIKMKIIPSKLRFYWYDAYYFVDDVNLIELQDGGNDKAEKTVEDSLLTAENLKKHLADNKEIVLPTVHFEHNSAKLLPDAKKSLDTLADFMQKNPEISLEFLGYTDDTGDSLKNISLSLQRAKNTAEYIISSGIDKSRVTFFGFGNSFPLVPNNSPANRKRNRRVTIRKRREDE